MERAIFSKELIEVECAYCSVVFLKSKTNSKKKYCSQNCNRLAKQKRARKIVTEGVMIKCFTCNKEFEPTANQLNAKFSFCSKECRNKGWKRNVKTIPCKNCNTLFNVEGKNKVFCSKECRETYQYKNRYVTKNCVYCDELYEVEIWNITKRKYCSRDCYFKYVASRNPNNTTCHQCNAEMYKAPSLQNTQKYWFCSRECMGNYFRINKLFSGSNNKRFLGFKFKRRNKYYGENWRQQRDLARERDNYTCKICKITEDEYGKQMSVHHIYPFVLFNNNFDKANDLNNLISLCEPCHRRIHKELKPSIYHLIDVPDEW